MGATLMCQGNKITSADLSNYDIPDDGMYIIATIEKEDKPEVISGLAKIVPGHTISNDYSTMSMFSASLSKAQIAFLLENPKVKFVECDGVVSIAQKS
ncbi:hypothetical protein CYMTET_14772 [Cymbomonas tetramitiformis]|uniref:Inhibitor I9 domain-containing protein n=1 Tax=Cymbomonas tetramitiformis TaxID=36881 RepID=A0AAE0GFG0_9CHLO|nr:hypothetical protein CYMTET_14772 [Cymbomonas tetramitiformis]